jgi:hydroxyacylglutathione hydrolase
MSQRPCDDTGHRELRKRAFSTCSHTPLKELIIGHSHSHSDHIAGDSELANFTSPFLTKTTLIPPHNATLLESAYSIGTWPTDIGKVDLGNRVLDIIPIPGHQKESIAVYDRETGLLLTGDSVYPGRIYIPQTAIQKFKDSHARLQKFVDANEVSWVLGCHIEQKQTPFEEYPSGTVRQPNEHVLQLPVEIVGEMSAAVAGLGSEIGQTMFREFSLVVVKQVE